MFKEHTRISILTKFGTLDFVFASRLMALRFALDESRNKEVISFSVAYFSQYETDTITNASNRLGTLIDNGNRAEPSKGE